MNIFEGSISENDAAVVIVNAHISNSSKYFTGREEEDSGHIQSQIDEGIASLKGAPRST